MPDKTPETPPPIPAPYNTDPAVISAINDAGARAQRAEARAAVAEEASRRSEAAASYTARQNAPRGVDPIDRLADEDVTLSPDQRKSLLAEAITGRARQIAGKAIDVMRQENERRDVALESRLAMNNVMAHRPELNQPENASNFAAAMTKAKFEFEAAGVAYSAADLAQRAAGVYDSTFRPKAEKPPFVEGANNPALGGFPQGQQVQQGKSYLENTYGMKEGQISPPFDPNDPEAIRKMNNEYVNNINKPLLAAGAVTGMAEILRGGEA